MEALGNDYIYIDRDLYPTLDYPALSRTYSDRHTGIGGDGIVTYARGNDGTYEMRIYNKDGSEAEMCGNAIRCVAKLLYEEGLCRKDPMPIRTAAGVKELDLFISKKHRVRSARVMMGVPQVAEQPIVVEEQSGSVVDVGNPHFVLLSDSPIADFPLDVIGPRLEESATFPEGTNVEVIRPLDRQTLEMRVWERGSGLTRACGTGACASAALAIRQGLVDTTVTVQMPGGELVIDWTGEADEPIYMTGPARRVFEGTLLLK
jgi:diaminopimelate epimerase